MRADEVVRRLGGRATAGEILQRATEYELRNATATGRLQRLARGVYATPELPAPLAVAARHHGILSHASAAAQLRLPLLVQPEAVHVTVPRNAHRRTEPGVVLHYADAPGERVTPPIRTVLDCAVTLPFREALAVADSAVRLDLARPEDLLAAARAWPARGRQRAMTVTRHARPLAANPFESGLRAAVIQAGLTGFEPQVEIKDGAFAATVDLADPELGLVLEADSFAHHGSRAALQRDCRRYDELVRRGWLVLRFAWEHVMFDADWVATVVCDVSRLCRAPRRTWSGFTGHSPASADQLLLAQRSRKGQNRTVAKVPTVAKPTRW